MQSIERAFALLQAIRAQGGRAGVSEVARSTGLPKSTVSRILSSLEDVGAVERLDSAGGYAIGPGLVALADGGASLGNLREVARPYLKGLTESLGESSGLTVADGPAALYVDHFASDGSVRTRDWTGMRFPFHTVAGGVALMMTWPDGQIDDFAGRGLEAFSTQTVTTKAALRDKVGRARRDGFVWTMGEFDVEINGVSAPVRNSDGVAVGAISVYGPSYRFPGDRDGQLIGEEVREVSRLIQDQLQH